MGKIFFKQFELGSIAAGGTKEGDWTADRNYILHKIFVKEYTATEIGTRFLNCTFRIDDYVFTLDKVRGEIFDGYTNQVPELGIDLAKDKTFYYSVKNEHGSSAISPYIVLMLEEKE